MKLSVAISPCPNDTYIYGALANRLIESPFDFQFEYHDIQALNDMAKVGIPDLVKMSYYNYLQVADRYRILPCGGAIGRGCGPLLISNNPDLIIDSTTKIAIPGINTTAYFLLDYFLNPAIGIVPMRFDEIEEAILTGKVDAGVIIHENRFTYQSKGLHLIKDLGAYWEANTLAPIPLGCLCVRNDIEQDLDAKLTDLVRKSIAYANNHYDKIETYIKSLAQEMEEDVIKAHIDLYVNDFSYDAGMEGNRALEEMKTHYLRQKSFC